MQHSTWSVLAWTLVGVALCHVSVALNGGVSDRQKRSFSPICLFNCGDQTTTESDDSSTQTLIELQRHQYCSDNCATPWSTWSLCTRPCGGGNRTRTRSSTTPASCSSLDKFECTKHTEETETCNIVCPNGGTLNLTGGCDCPVGRRGQCCQQVVYCEFPGSLAHGTVEGMSPYVYNSVVSYRCHEGYYRLGSQNRKCQEGNTWSGTKPTCEAITCVPPVPPSKGTGSLITSLESGQNYTHGMEVGYICSDGYELQGSALRRCSALPGQTTGRWSGLNPQCIKISCGDPGLPLYSQRYGGSFKFRDTVYYDCSEGYRLIGSANRSCLSSGVWSGHQTQCQVITCQAPTPRLHGTFTPNRETPFVFGQTVQFGCEEGYLVNGSSRLTCVKDERAVLIGGGGVWDSQTPTCRAVSCGDPGLPDNSARDGHVFYHPHNITYVCFAGFTLQGASSIHCANTGAWSATPPTCVACPRGSYKQDTQPNTGCEPCPTNSNTSTDGSTHPRQCACNHGYTGPPGGPCQEVRCGILDAPDNGTVTSCDDTVGEVCVFACDEGFTRTSGSGRRVCLDDGSWTGAPSQCSACAVNTYKKDELSCMPCPRDSHTSAPAQSLTGCVCDRGYHGPAGGPCNDVNECAANGGRGDCEDLCENTVGGYRCGCSIPGYVIDASDPHTCRVEDYCRNLTVEDAPANGGLVCHWYREQNSQHCRIMCDNHYEFPTGSNNYETCSISTAYRWTHEERNEPIDDCIPEYAPDIQLEAETKYFVTACANLTESEKAEVRTQFARMLTDEGICMRGTTKVCRMENVGIICGPTMTRKRRDLTEEEVTSVNLDVTMKAEKFKEKVADCDQICAMLRIPMARCERLCLRTYRRFLKASMLYNKRKLEVLYQNHDAVTLRAAQRVFEVDEDDAITVSNPIIDCPQGMTSKDDVCVPCSRGSYLNSSGECVVCAVNFYQPNLQQLSCLPCPAGETSRTTGAVSCTACPSGRYGLGCGNTCSPCMNGTCDAVTGECHCHSGWEGDACDADISGCVAGACYTNCTDIPAPGTGYQCAPCPTGFTGDGTFCDPVPPAIAGMALTF